MYASDFVTLKSSPQRGQRLTFALATSTASVQGRRLRPTAVVMSRIRSSGSGPFGRSSGWSKGLGQLGIVSDHPGGPRGSGRRSRIEWPGGVFRLRVTVHLTGNTGAFGAVG